MMKRAQSNAIEPATDSFYTEPAIARPAAKVAENPTGAQMKNHEPGAVLANAPPPPAAAAAAMLPQLSSAPAQYATSPTHAAAARLAALATLANLPGATLPSNTYDYSLLQQSMDERLLRLAQIQRERDEINMYRRARLYEDLQAQRNVDSQSAALSGLQALIQSQNQAHGYLGQTAPALASAVSDLQAQRNVESQPASLSGLQALIQSQNQAHGYLAQESLRAESEAKHLEELAAAARTRARNLALAGALEAQSRYDNLVKNHASGQDGGGL
jgi:hypothetical protein